MRIALVSPYSWSYPGGVTRHVQGLAESFIAKGHSVTVLAPFDPPDRLSVLLHRGEHPQVAPAPNYLVPLGRTVGVRANGAMSNLLLAPRGVLHLHHQLKTGGYDVVHIHEPVAPALGWAATDWTALPLVGTFHTYNEHRFSHGLATALGVRRMLNRLHVRIAVSEPAAWTARSFFGGHYRVVPNGVHLVAAVPSPAGEGLRVVFVGQPVERKGLPLLIRAYEALRDQLPCELTLIGPSPEDVGPLLGDMRGVRALGKVDDDRKRRELEEADVLCAPSLGGESFGMVLTEAFAAGTPVVASDIAGYRDVVRDGVDGLLVAPGDAQAIADALYKLWADPARRAEMAQAASGSADRFAWPNVADQVMEAYKDAIATPVPAGVLRRAAVRVGALPADLKPRAPARRLPTLEPAARQRRRPALKAASVALSLGVGALALVALRRMGLHNVTSALSHTNLGYVLLAVFLMCASMALRAVSWHASLRAGLPSAKIRLVHAMQGLFIGVLVSSTLPANLGEPSRALVVARRTERPWENLPIVAGTLMSQVLLNVAAIGVLGVVTFASVGIFSGYERGLAVGAVVAVLALALVLVAPRLLRRGASGSRTFRVHSLATRLRSGLTVMRRPRLAAVAVASQLSAWALQWLAVYVLLVGLHLASTTGFVAAAAVLFGVNITMLLPLTPGDVGVFQAAVAFVLNTGWHVAYSRGVAYGVVLQAAELATAIVMGVPALLKEGLSWRHVTLRAAVVPTITLPGPAVFAGPSPTLAAATSDARAGDGLAPHHEQYRPR